MTDVDPELVARARAWQRAPLLRVCDLIETWEHGTVARASACPSYYQYNLVRVEDATEIELEALLAFTDRALDGLAHRRIDADHIEVGRRLRPGLQKLGWQTTELVLMHHDAPVPPGDAGDAGRVEEVGYDEVEHLRLEWHYEGFPSLDPTDHLAHAREIHLGFGARVLAIYEHGRAAGYAQFESYAPGASEVAQVFVSRGHRDRGLGTTLTSAAIEAAKGAGELWITADNEDRPKHMYERLGFRPVCLTAEFLRLP